MRAVDITFTPDDLLHVVDVATGETINQVDAVVCGIATGDVVVEATLMFLVFDQSDKPITDASGIPEYIPERVIVQSLHYTS
jgi:hypothetical protein